MNCDQVSEKLGPYLDGELDEEIGRRIGEHLATCADCRAELEQLRRLAEIGRAESVPDPGESYWRELPGRILEQLPVGKPAAYREHLRAWRQRWSEPGLLFKMMGFAATAVLLFFAVKIALPPSEIKDIRSLAHRTEKSEQSAEPAAPSVSADRTNEGAPSGIEEDKMSLDAVSPAAESPLLNERTKEISRETISPGDAVTRESGFAVVSGDGRSEERRSGRDAYDDVADLDEAEPVFEEPEAADQKERMPLSPVPGGKRSDRLKSTAARVQPVHVAGSRDEMAVGEISSEAMIQGRFTLADTCAALEQTLMACQNQGLKGRSLQSNFDQNLLRQDTVSPCRSDSVSRSALYLYELVTSCNAVIMQSTALEFYLAHENELVRTLGRDRYSEMFRALQQPRTPEP